MQAQGLGIRSSLSGRFRPVADKPEGPGLDLDYRTFGGKVRLEVEGRQDIQDATEAEVARAVVALRSSGPHSFAILSSESGSYIQVAGGSQTCVIEVRDAASGRHYRAHKLQPHSIFPDGTKLAFGAGTVVLQRDEWFTAAQAAPVLLQFRGGELLPSLAPGWRDVTDLIFGDH